MLKELQWDGMGSLMLKEIANGMAWDLSCLRSCQWQWMGSLMLNELANELSGVLTMMNNRSLSESRMIGR